MPARTKAFRSLAFVSLVLTTTLANAQNEPRDENPPSARDEEPSDGETSGDSQRETGEEINAEEEPNSDAIVPPQLVEFVEATYPPEAVEQNLEATVILLITIDADGSVSEATVETPVGYGFDEAAVAAVEQFRFSPATRGGEPFAVRIRYQYEFLLPEVEAPEPPPEGGLEGRVLSSMGDEPLAGAEVIITSEDESVARRAVTNDDGAFEFEALPPGLYDLRLVPPEPDEGEPEHVGTFQQEEIRAGEITSLTYRLEIASDDNDDDGPTFGATAVIDPPPREVTRRTVSREALTRIPGTRGDALRAIEILPGVARPPFGSGQLVVRGSAPGDSQVFVEGAPLPAIYHFGGLTSVINSRLLDRIDFVPGNFSARYGRKTGGVVEVDVRDPATDGFHGVAELSVIDVSVLAELPLTENASMALGVRRSMIDVVFDNLFADNADIGITASPVYYDYQAFVTYRPTPNDRLRFLVYGSNDRFAINISDSLGDDPNIRGDAGLTQRFNHLQLGWQHQFGADTQLNIDVMVGLQQLQFGLSDLISFDLNVWETSHRIELTHQATRGVRIIAGIDSQLTPFNIAYVGPRPSAQDTSGADPDLSDPPLALDIAGVAYRPAFYLESELRPIEDWQIILGGRVDYDRQIRRFNFDPRLVMSYQIHENVRLKGGMGMYSQPPDFQESGEQIGNPNLDWEHSSHYGLGIDWDIVPGIRVGVEGFYKRIWDRVVSTPGGTGAGFSNDGLGRIYGMELAAQVNPEGRNWFGYLSYTLSRSERQDAPEEPWRLFDFDQTHIFTLTASYRFPRNWTIGGTLRLVSGNPSTAARGSIANINTLDYSPITPTYNSERNPLFNRLDVRVEKVWTFRHWRLGLFLDIQNVYNQQNQEGLVYNYDFTQQVPINGLPIIPALGIRGEM